MISSRSMGAEEGEPTPAEEEDCHTSMGFLQTLTGRSAQTAILILPLVSFAWTGGSSSPFIVDSGGLDPLHIIARRR